VKGGPFCRQRQPRCDLLFGVAWTVFAPLGIEAQEVLEPRRTDLARSLQTMTRSSLSQKPMPPGKLSTMACSSEVRSLSSLLLRSSSALSR